MKYLIYLSAAIHLLDNEDLKDILAKSRQNNVRDGITGILLYHEGNFIQVLEGDPIKIAETYRRILNDDRHKGVHKLIERDTDRRNFPEWSMGYKAISADQFNAIEGYRDLSEENIVGDIQNSISSNHPILILLKSFADNIQF